MIHREPHGEVLLLRFEHGKANTIDLEFLAELDDALGDLGDAKAAVLTGSGRMFSAGVDLFRIANGGQEYVDRFLPLLSDVLLRLFTTEIPVVAAVNGHAIAGGCLLAIASDYRVMAAGDGRIGVPELLVGVPMPTVPLELLRSVLSPADVHYLLVTGRTVDAGEAMARGIVHEVVPEAALLDRALAMAGTLAAIPADAFRRTKKALRAPALEAIAARRAADDAELAPVWGAPATIAAIRGYLERTIGKNR